MSFNMSRISRHQARANEMGRVLAQGDAANTPNRRIFLDLFGALENCGVAGHIAAL
jgi:hypothetical protein